MPKEEQDTKGWAADRALRVEKNQDITEGVFVSTVEGHPLWLRGGSIDAIYIEDNPDLELDNADFCFVLVGGETLQISQSSFVWLSAHLTKFSFLMREDQDGPP